MKGSEKRRTPRHKGSVPVEMGSFKGLTRDFSGEGIFFETDRSLSIGQHIDFTFVLEHIHPGCPVRITCKGEIVRVEKNGEKIGVAATINSYLFE